MDTTELTERLRAVDDVEVENVDAIIAGALRQGRRRRVRQRALPALAGVVALATALGLAGVLAVRDGRTSAPVATTTPSAPSSTARPSPIGPPLTSADVLGVVQAYLPDGMSVTERYLFDDPDVAKENATALMALEDGDGPAQAEALLRSSGEPGSGCTRQGHCRRIRADGKTFYEYTDWKTRGGVRYYDVATYYYRPDGLVVGVQQHNYVDRGGPVTRPTRRGLTTSEGWPVTGKTVPLTQAEVQALLTAPEWDGLAPRCRYDRIWGYC